MWFDTVTNKNIFIIAEAGVNHNGDLLLGFKLIDVACQAGADAIKFQSFKAERLVSSQGPKAKYQLQNTDTQESQLQMLKRLELSPDMQRQLYDYCTKKGIMFLSTPFDELSADELGSLNVKMFKVSSGEVTNLEFLKHIARKGKPIILSTGMSTLSEVREAVEAILKTNPVPLALLHCVSNYPADPADVNLRAMDTMRKEFNLPIGYSDHSTGIDIAIAAVAKGAVIIEKHLTLDQNLPGPDHKASLEPKEFSDLVRSIRRVELALGDGIKQPTAAELDTAAVARKSLVAACDIASGTIIQTSMVTIKRPGTGLAPSFEAKVVGRKTKVFIAKDTLLKLEDLI